ncbi:MAG: ATP-binding protein, partial [Gammaproteobacteria bacterium]|nr:ATP-binding protein [Gammaproteobacteria bacterium]
HIPDVIELAEIVNNTKKITANNIDNEPLKQRIAAIFASMLHAKNMYLQIRYIDNKGMEIVRVDRVNNKIVHVDDNALQDKSDRPYVTDTLRLAPEQIYLSDINLNREYGKVSVPHQEVLRSAIPIYNATSDKISGLVVIVAEISHELHHLLKRIALTSRQAYVTNDQGDYLLHPDVDKRYGFDLGSRYLIQQDFPATGSLFQPDLNLDELILYPKDSSSNKAAAFRKIYFDPDRSNRFITIGITQDYDEIVSAQTQVLNRIVLWAIFLCTLSVLSAYIFSRRITRPLADIQQYVKNFSLNNHSNQILQISNDDELGQLARSFHDMATRVYASQQELKSMNDSLEHIIEKRTEQLQNSKARQENILDNIVDGLLTIDSLGTVKSMNLAAENIFLYKSGEVIGKNIKMLMPEPYQSEHDTYLNNYTTTGKKNIIGIGREVVGLRKDGTVFPLDLAVSEMIIDDERIFSGIVRDITERKYMDKMKNEFISTVSHELRTPLTSIRGSLGLITGGAVGELPEQAKEMLKIASNNTERLLLLINDILDIQKIESGQMVFNFKQIDLSDFIKTAIAENESYATQHKVKLLFIDNEINHYVLADKDRLMQVMANLLSNACKFSPDNEVVKITLARQDNNIIRISVIDNGPGVPEEFQPKLFDKFTQSDASDTRKKGGTGLGLNITRVIVEKHGGYIGFVSGEYTGSTFYVDLPEINRQQSSVNITAETDNLATSILIVEDDPDIAKLLQHMLQQAGHYSDIAHSVKEAK